MSRTGSVAEGPPVLTEVPGGRVKAPANRLQNGGGDLPAFREHVLRLEGMAEVATAPDGTYLPRQDATELVAEAKAPGRQSDPGNAQKAAAPPRLTVAAHQAMLMLERSDVEHGLPVAAAPVDTALPSAEVADPENTQASPQPSANRDAMLPAVSAERRAERASAHLPAAARTARMAEVAVHSAVREATGNSQTGPSEQRNAPQQISTMPETRVIDDGRSARSLGRADELPVKVVRQETHFAPVQRLGPGAQIAEILETELGSTHASRSAQDVQPRPATRTVIRMLSIQLQPAELGTVTIRMALEGNVLELQLDAQRAATAELIRRDQGALTSLLRSAGYDVEGLIVHVADPDRTLAASGAQVQQGQQSQSNPAPQSHFGGAQPDGRSSDGMGGEAQSQSRSGGRGGSAAADAANAAPQSHAAPPRPRGVYV